MLIDSEMGARLVRCPACQHQFSERFIDSLSEGILRASADAGLQLEKIPSDLPAVDVECTDCKGTFKLNLQIYLPDED